MEATFNGDLNWPHLTSSEALSSCYGTSLLRVTWQNEQYELSLSPIVVAIFVINALENISIMQERSDESSWMEMWRKQTGVKVRRGSQGRGA